MALKSCCFIGFFTPGKIYKSEETTADPAHTADPGGKTICTCNDHSSARYPTQHYTTSIGFWQFGTAEYAQR